MQVVAAEPVPFSRERIDQQNIRELPGQFACRRAALDSGERQQICPRLRGVAFQETGDRVRFVEGPVGRDIRQFNRAVGDGRHRQPLLEDPVKDLGIPCDFIEHLLPVEFLRPDEHPRLQKPAECREPLASQLHIHTRLEKTAASQGPPDLECGDLSDHARRGILG